MYQLPKPFTATALKDRWHKLCFLTSVTLGRCCWLIHMQNEWHRVAHVEHIWHCSKATSTHISLPFSLTHWPGRPWLWKWMIALRGKGIWLNWLKKQHKFMSPLSSLWLNNRIWTLSLICCPFAFILLSIGSELTLEILKTLLGRVKTFSLHRDMGQKMPIWSARSCTGS